MPKLAFAGNADARTYRVGCEVAAAARASCRAGADIVSTREHQLLEVAGDVQRLRRLQIAVWPERASHLKRVEGIPSGRVGQAREKRPRKRRAESELHQVMERSE